MIHRAFRYRLYPTSEQEFILREYAGAARFVYNLAVEQRRDWWRQYKAQFGRSLSLASQSRELTDLRAEHDWLSAIPRCILDYALQDADRAFSNFFKGAGFPGFRSKDRSVAFRTKGLSCRWSKLNAKWAEVRLPRGATIKFRLTRPIIGEIKNVAIQCVAGRWMISFQAEREAKGVLTGGSVGIDRGIANTLTLSSGEMLSMPASLAAQILARKRAQRALARCKKGSNRRGVQRVIVARHHARCAEARSHWLHEQSTSVARRFGTVALEKLGTVKMTAAGPNKRGLNRSILEQGWGMFAQMLDYKLAERGGVLHYVNPAYTSQTCSACGSIAKESRKSQASFECIDCGYIAHADVNAAINILRRSPAGVEVPGYGAVEAHTINLAA